jgi:tetratricopeptide (TPR) repeat protein
VYRWINCCPFTEAVVVKREQLKGLSLQEQRRVFSENTVKYEERIEANVWDTEAWTALITEAQSKDISISRGIYERFLAQFPTAGRYWKYYAEQELAAKNFENVEKIFTRCLLKCPNIELWKCYLNYIQTVKQHKEQIIEAFEFALEHMAMDISANHIWQDYILFVKSQKVPTLSSTLICAVHSPLYLYISTFTLHPLYMCTRIHSTLYMYCNTHVYVLY